MRKFGLVHTEIMFLLTFFREFRYLIKKRKILRLQGMKAENITGWHLNSLSGLFLSHTH